MLVFERVGTFPASSVHSVCTDNRKFYPSPTARAGHTRTHAHTHTYTHVHTHTHARTHNLFPFLLLRAQIEEEEKRVAEKIPSSLFPLAFSRSEKEGNRCRTLLLPKDLSTPVFPHFQEEISNGNYSLCKEKKSWNQPGKPWIGMPESLVYDLRSFSIVMGICIATCCWYFCPIRRANERRWLRYCEC